MKSARCQSITGSDGLIIFVGFLLKQTHFGHGGNRIAFVMVVVVVMMMGTQYFGRFHILLQLLHVPLEFRPPVLELQRKGIANKSVGLIQFICKWSLPKWWLGRWWGPAWWRSHRDRPVTDTSGRGNASPARRFGDWWRPSAICASSWPAAEDWTAPTTSDRYRCHRYRRYHRYLLSLARDIELLTRVDRVSSNLNSYFMLDFMGGSAEINETDGVRISQSSPLVFYYYHHCIIFLHPYIFPFFLFYESVIWRFEMLLLVMNHLIQ